MVLFCSLWESFILFVHFSDRFSNFYNCWHWIKRQEMMMLSWKSEILLDYGRTWCLWRLNLMALFSILLRTRRVYRSRQYTSIPRGWGLIRGTHSTISRYAVERRNSPGHRIDIIITLCRLGYRRKFVTVLLLHHCIGS